MRGCLLSLNCARAGAILDLLFCVCKNKKANPDVWPTPKCEAVVELCSALSALLEWQTSMDLGTGPGWTALLGDSIAVVVLDGAEKKFSWGELEDTYRKAFEGQYYRPEMRERAILFVALRSRGLIEPVVRPSWLDFTQPPTGGPAACGELFTEPRRLRFYVCQDTLFDGVRGAKSAKDFLEEKMRCIIG